MASSGLNSTEGARNISGEVNNESKEVVYSSVTWRSKNKQKEEGDNTNQKDGTEGRLSRDFINKAAEMVTLNEVEPPNVKGKTECEYAQVKYKDKNVVIDWINDAVPNPEEKSNHWASLNKAVNSYSRWFLYKFFTHKVF